MGKYRIWFWKLGKNGSFFEKHAPFFFYRSKGRVYFMTERVSEWGTGRS